MAAHPYYSQEHHGPYELVDIGSLPLLAGGTLEQCKLAVATHGTLNAAKDNVILVPTWYSGTSKIMADVYLGQQRALDPTKYFIVIVNQIGNGLSTSPHDWEEGPQSFPTISIADDVEAQRRLLTRHFGIKKLALVVGGSMGGQQALEWAVHNPDMVERVAAIAATSKASDYLAVLLGSMSDALTAAPGESPDEIRENGFSRLARFWSAVGWSPDFFRARRFEALGFDAAAPFVEGFMNGYFAPMEPANLTSMGVKAFMADPARGGDMAAALGGVKAKTVLMPIDTDMLFSVGDVERECKMIPGAELRVLNSTDGHLALFGTDPNLLKQIDEVIIDLLQRTSGAAA